MLLAPSRDDFRVIARTAGSAVGLLGIGMAMLSGLALAMGDINAATALACGAAPAIAIGARTRMILARRRHLSWTRGVVTAVVAWSACSLVASVPLYLSGHYATWPDALFDAVSGLTDTGMTLIADLDHLPDVFILFRSLLELAGGVTFLVVSLGLLSARTVMASPMTIGDARDERILPRPEQLWLQAGKVVAGLLGFGLVAVAVALAAAGVPLASLPVSAVSLAVGAITTGGFVPTSGGVGAFHAVILELVLMTLMLGGAISITILATARRPTARRLLHDLDTRMFAFMLVATIAGTIIGLGRAGTFTDLWPLFHHGVFLSVSTVTTTGMASVAPALLASDFGFIAPSVLVTAMVVGGMTGSMAGGFKTLRLGFLLKGLVADVRRVLLPESALVLAHFERDGHRERLTDAHVRSAATIVLLTLTAILTGAVVLLWADGTVTLNQAILTATSAVANVGLDVGVLTTAQPLAVKAVFTALMLLGRLEWLAVFATAGYLVAGLRGH